MLKKVKHGLALSPCSLFLEIFTEVCIWWFSRYTLQWLLLHAVSCWRLNLSEEVWDFTDQHWVSAQSWNLHQAVCIQMGSSSLIQGFVFWSAFSKYAGLWDMSDITENVLHGLALHETPSNHCYMGSDVTRSALVCITQFYMKHSFPWMGSFG